MNSTTQPKTGEIVWCDLTVADAAQVRDFYRDVVGWTPSSVAMGDYEDYGMSADGKMVAGVCHARGANAVLPSVWLVYILVTDLDASLAQCTKLGGTIVAPIRKYGGQSRYAVIRDPAGAVVALYEGKVG